MKDLDRHRIAAVPGRKQPPRPINGYNEQDADDVINDLDLFLMPKGPTTTDLFSESIWAPPQDFMPLEHIFFEIPTTGEYEIWVEQANADLGGGQDYALAWWAFEAPNAVSMGDFDGNGIVDAGDYNAWKGDFGMTVTPGTEADGNGDWGWRDRRG